jgi:hypothetical protein
MAKQTLNIGSSANDGTGTSLRAGGDIINDNFNEIYTAFGDGSTLGSPAIPHKIGGTNFARSIIIGHSTTGTLNAAQDNLAIGDNALNSVTSGDQNIVLGSNAGTAITTATANVYIGRNSGSSNATANSNIGLGVDTLEDANFTGTSNVAIGRSAGTQVESGNYNILIGLSAGDNITTGHGNLIMGANTDADSATGSRQLKISGYDGSTTTTWLSGDSSGNLTTVGDVTLANNKKVIFGDAGEHIAGDGTNLTISSSGKTIIDSVGDVELDAASGVIDFIGNGTVYGNVAVSGSDLILKSRLTDGDISLRGNDGGLEVVALTLDMSDAGSAIFNNNVNVGGNANITGNLTVNGTTTTVNSTNTTLDDNLLELNSGATSNANDSGIIIERGSTGDNAIIMWDESADKFTLGTTTATADSTGNISVTTGTLVANIEGNITGNISTATALATGRTIGMTGDVVWTSASFDGSGNVTGTSALQANTVSSTELVSATTLLILDSSGSTLKTIIGAGS